LAFEIASIIARNSDLLFVKATNADSTYGELGIGRKVCLYELQDATDSSIKELTTTSAGAIRYIH
jgi:hypothetical protein